eukprot:scaffold14552_cov146-Isochrysis_galbana.AAC.1
MSVARSNWRFQFVYWRPPPTVSSAASPPSTTALVLTSLSPTQIRPSRSALPSSTSPATTTPFAAPGSCSSNAMPSGVFNRTRNTPAAPSTAHRATDRRPRATPHHAARMRRPGGSLLKCVHY